MAAHRLGLDHALAGVAVALGAAGVDWAPLKGYDLGGRVYRSPEERPTGDLDVLIAGADLDRARRALEAAGWRCRYPGPRAWRYLQEEGYAWPMVDAGGVLLELHVRLWASLPAGAGAELRSRWLRAPELGATAHRLQAEDAYLLAAVHTWLHSAPRPLLDAWDLDRLAAHLTPARAEAVVARAMAWQVQLPVGLAAAWAQALWPGAGPGATNRAIADRLLTSLRQPERRLLRRARQQGIDAVSPAAMALARLLAGRPSRGGWRTALRRVWAHPGVVEQESWGAHSWPRRRLGHLLMQLGCFRLGSRLATGPQASTEQGGAP